jgi:hypothetical protein
MPGMMDTSAAEVKKEGEPAFSADQAAIEKIETYVENYFGEYKYNNVLLVIGPGRASEELVKTLEIARLIFEPARIIPCFSRCVSARSRKEAETMYKDFCSNDFKARHKWNFADMAGPIYIGETAHGGEEASELMCIHRNFTA